MSDLINLSTDLANDPRVFAALRGLVVVLVGLVAIRLVSRALGSWLPDHLDAHRSLLLRRAVVYTLCTLLVIVVLRELGFELHVLLGAAGVLTVAIGFASQTSASNVVSGLFLIGEQPFAVGDVIRVGATTGEVISIDFLSVKLRTFDNLMVRIPNEVLIKSELTNLTRFPIRRVDLPIGVAYKEDLQKVQEIVMQVADRNPLSLEEPAPLFIIQGFGDSAVNLQFSLWAVRDNFLALRNSIYIEIKQAFDSAGIEIPFPHRTLYSGSATEPLPIRLMERPAAP